MVTVSETAAGVTIESVTAEGFPSGATYVGQQVDHGLGQTVVIDGVKGGSAFQMPTVDAFELAARTTGRGEILIEAEFPRPAAVRVVRASPGPDVMTEEVWSAGPHSRAVSVRSETSNDPREQPGSRGRPAGRGGELSGGVRPPPGE